MEFNYIADGIDAVIIDNFYTDDQLKEILLELKWMTKPSMLQGEKYLKSALAGNEILTSKNGVFLEEVFRNWKNSALISHGMEQTTCKEFQNKLLEFNTMFKGLIECDSRSHLLSYYENSQYYRPHKDNFFFTILNYFHTEPKQFEGGEVVLYSCNSTKQATIEVKHNRAIVIMSCTTHEVKEIKSKLQNEFSGNGRYCNAMFLALQPRKDNNDSN
jgi:hypothetical protein